MYHCFRILTSKKYNFVLLTLGSGAPTRRNTVTDNNQNSDADEDTHKTEASKLAFVKLLSLIVRHQKRITFRPRTETSNN